MEKQTKILVGAGALVALYLLYNKYQKDVLNKKVVTIPAEPVVTLPVEPVVTLPVEPVVTLPVETVVTLPVETAPFEPLPIFTNPIDDFINPVVPVKTAPFEPVFTLPVEPAPFEPVFTLPVEPAPFEPVFTLPVESTPFESAPFEPLPIFTNPIDDFINPVVPVETAPFEPVFTLPVEPTPFEPAPFEPLPIFTNPIDDFINPVEKVEKYTTIGNAINDFTALGSFHRNGRIGQIRSFVTNIINSDKIKIGDKVRIYKNDDVYILGTVTQYNSNGLLFYKEEDSVAPSDSVIYNGFSIQVLTSVIEPSVVTLPVEPAPFEPVVTLPFETVHTLPFEPATFEPLPIFTNPIDDFINPVVPVEPAPFEPVFTLPVEPAPFEPVFTPPVESVPVESIMIGTVLGNDLNEICASEERTLLFTSLFDWNRASTWSGLTFYEDSQLNIPVTNAKYIKKWMDNNRNIYEISNGLVGKSLGDCIDLIQTTNKLTKLDPKIWGGTIGVNFILGNTLEDICSKQKSQNVSDITKLYLEQELWTAYYQNLTGVTLFIDETLKTPYGDGFITTFGLDGLTIYEINNGIVGKSLGTCSVLINKPIIESINPIDSFVYSAPVEPQYKKVEKYITVGNAINDFTVLGSLHRNARIGQIRSYATNIINSDKIKIGDKIRIYKSDKVYILGTVTQYNSNGLLFYREEDSVAPSDNVMYNGFSIQVLTSVIEPIVYEEPYTVQGGGGFSAGNSIDEVCNNSQSDQPIVIYHKAYNGIGTYGQLGAKLYKDREVKIPYTDSIYVTKWRANPRQEIMKLDGNGTVIQILSPC